MVFLFFDLIPSKHVWVGTYIMLQIGCVVLPL